jgi:hypothetical protein
MTTLRNITKSHRTGVSTFASRTSQSTGQSLQKSLLYANADKLFLKNFQRFKKIKTQRTADTQ